MQTLEESTRQNWTERQLEAARRDAAELALGIQERDQKIAELRAILESQQVSVREAHHRVANGLQIVSALVHLQIRKTPDQAIRDILQSAASRVDALARFHRHLTNDVTTESVDFAEYLLDTAPDISASTNINCTVQANSPVLVDGHTAANLAIVVNELVVNSKKHAYAGGHGRVEIVCTKLDGHIHLEVIDYGPGLSNDIDIDQADGLGLSLIRSIVRQFGGKMTLQNDHGARFKIAIPEREISSRVRAVGQG